MFKPKHVSLGTIAVMVASVAFLTLAPAGAAHVDSPTVTAQHAFIGDPLFGLDTPDGSLFGIAPDERTAMASTTKLMTLDVTLHAVDDGVVALNDQVTVDPYAASIDGSPCPPVCNSVMTDVNGVELEAGEVVSLETLIRGMMYPSGNDAAWAIAYYLARAYGNDLNDDGVVDGNDFVERMNQHALDLGLSDTHFTNANGWDNVNHYTTARELSKIINHGLDAHPHYGQVIGLQGTYTDTSQGPNGPKTYMWTRSSTYPGWEGSKGGNTTNCNGAPNGYCVAHSAKRIGRRVVVSLMQGVGSNLAKTMLDYGFAQIFHPDPHATSSPLLFRGGAAVDRQDVDCLDNGRVLSAVLPQSGPVSLALWKPDVDASLITKLQETTLPGSGNSTRSGVGPQGDVAVTHLSSSDFAMATRKGASVELSRWAIDRAGALTLLASGIKAGSATTMGLQPVYGDMFLTAMTTPYPDRELVLKSWRLEGSGLTLLDTLKSPGLYSEVAIAGPLTTDPFSGHRAVTASLEWGGWPLEYDVWAVDHASGEISLVGEDSDHSPSIFNVRSNVTISPFYVKTASGGELAVPAYYAVGSRSSSGQLDVDYLRVDATGKPVEEGEWNPSPDLPADEARLASLGTGGFMSASRDAAGQVRLIAWDAQRNADDTISGAPVSQHDPGPAASLDLCRIPSAGHSEGDYVTGTKDLDGLFRLRAYRSGDRPY